MLVIRNIRQVQQAGHEPAALRGAAGGADPARAADRGGGPRRARGGQQVSVMCEGMSRVETHPSEM